jgi:hypothetical protein
MEKCIKKQSVIKTLVFNKRLYKKEEEKGIIGYINALSSFQNPLYTPKGVF